MPTYSFQCEKCGAMRDEFRRLDKRNDPCERCDNCGQDTMKRMFTVAAISMGAHGHNAEYTKTGRRKGS
jgi:putative FmdB family regulatory protein